MNLFLTHTSLCGLHLKKRALFIEEKGETSLAQEEMQVHVCTHVQS